MKIIPHRTEAALRRLVVRTLVRPIAKERHVRRQALSEFSIVAWNLGDHVIAFDPRDEVIGKEIIDRRSYHRASFMDVVDLVNRHRGDRSSRVFLDVGANIGTQTIYALLSRSFQKAVSIEPVASNARLLRLNVELNGFADRVAVAEMAAGDKAGEATINLARNNSGSHSLVLEGDGDTASVPVRRIDDVLAAQGVSAADVGLCWMDVEGYEREALAGADSLISASVPLNVEVNPRVYGVDGAMDLVRSMRQHYSSVATVTRRGLACIPLSSFEKRNLPEKFGDLVFV